MSDSPELLELEKTYIFQVVVRDGLNRFAGELNLSPEGMNLVVRGDEFGDRQSSFDFGQKIDQLVCRDGNATFILNELKWISGFDRSICSHPEEIGCFEIVYDVGNLIYSTSNLDKNEYCCAFDIYSETIERWVGITNMQEEIIRDYQSKDGLSGKTEFAVGIDGYGEVSVFYNLEMYMSLPQYTSGMSFPPSLSILFETGKPHREIREQYSKVFDIMSLVVGCDIDVQKVKVVYVDVMGKCDSDASLYYACNKYAGNKRSNSILFPLGENLKFDQFDLPPLPFEIFKNYFSLTESSAGYVSKYITYRRMENIEERFLGYYRLLEKLCHQKKYYVDGDNLKTLVDRSKPFLIKYFDDKKGVESFIERLPRLNESKYNTERNIIDFISSIPVEVMSDWKFQSKDVVDICKLRNNIVHANEYEKSDDKLNSFCKFVEVLLVLRLLCLLGVELEESAKIIPRIEGYSILKTDIEAWDEFFGQED